MFARLFKSNTAKDQPWIELEKGTRSWNEFDRAEQDAIVAHFTPKVRFLVQQQKRRLPQHYDMGELMSAGLEGLVQALYRYDPSVGTSLGTFAESRIVGCMLDEMRRVDPLTRSARNSVRSLLSIIERFESRYGRTPSDAELARASGMSVERVREALKASESQLRMDMAPLAERLSADGEESGGSPYNQTDRRERVAHVRRMLEKLSGRDKYILSMIYLENLPMRDVARVLDVSEGRVSQLHSQAIERLRSLYLRHYGA